MYVGIARIAQGVTKKNNTLKNISHGSHSQSFIEASNQKIDTTFWHDEGVMFLMEGPSNDYGIYEDFVYDGYKKRPSKQWYWIHHKQDILGFPDKFQGGEYGRFVASAILTFKLKNAYLTNLVKCGLNNTEGNEYLGIGCYNEESVQNCFEQFLIDEIRILDTKVIFVFGTNAYKKVIKFISESKLKDKNIKVLELPHPAGQRRGFKDTFYKALYFNIILKGLKQTDILSDNEVHSLIDLYVNDDD